MLDKILAGKKIAIWGLGKEGQACLEMLQLYHPQVADTAVIIESDEALVQNPHLLQNIEVLIKSPGVSLYKPEIQQLIRQGVLVTSSCDLFFRAVAEQRQLGLIAPITIGVTGTKGKSTTTSIIQALLTACGFRSSLGGNIGIPLVTLIPQLSQLDYVVAEISSYQAADLHSFPQYGMLLNLYPEHLQWHLSHQQYYQDKCNLLHSDVAIVPATAISQQYASWLKQPLYFQTPNGYHYDDDTHTLKYGHAVLLDVQSLKLLGKGNYNNLAAVFTLLAQLQLLDNTNIIPTLQQFEPLAHRLSTVAQKNNIYFIDDSISTIPEATINALDSFNPAPIIPILGGFDRQQDYLELIQYINKHHNIQDIITLGSTAKRIQDTIVEVATRPLTVHNAQSMGEAVNIAWQSATQIHSGAERIMVLLSPAAPSYDMYKNFEARGLDFLQQIQNLPMEQLKSKK